MKIIVYLFISFLFMACNGQNTDNLKKIPMTTEKFDIEQYNKGIKYDYIYTDGSGNKTRMKGENTTYEKKLNDGTWISQSGDKAGGYWEYIMPPTPAIFGSYNEYFPSGKVKVKIDKTTIDQYFDGQKAIEVKKRAHLMAQMFLNRLQGMSFGAGKVIF